MTYVGAVQQLNSNVGLHDGNGLCPFHWVLYVGQAISAKHLVCACVLLGARAAFRQLTSGVDNSMQCGKILAYTMVIEHCR